MRELRLETHRCWQVAVEGDGITAAAAELFFFFFPMWLALKRKTAFNNRGGEISHPSCKYQFR